MNKQLKEAVKEFDKQLARIEDLKQELHSIHGELFNLRQLIDVIGTNTQD